MQRCFGYDRSVKEGPDIAQIGALIGDPARANMLTALSGGRALTATELAAAGGITVQTASMHLAKLEAGGLLAQRKQGRHRYFTLADEATARNLAHAINTNTFRPYHSTDIRGVEIGGAAKNVLAIASGIVTGRGLGASAAAALTTRGFAELARFGRAFGARTETMMGLSGLGDLILTCGTAQSRNFSFGVALGQGETPQTAAHGKLAEGAFTAPVLLEMARAKGVDMPISAAVAGAILAFLWFNIPPARFYLSETGTMALTLALTVTAFSADTLGDGVGVFVLPILALPLTATVLSSVLQVFWKVVFKRKLFRVAPVHHHFEAIGWPPYKVTMRYWIITIIAGAFGLSLALLK